MPTTGADRESPAIDRLPTDDTPAVTSDQRGDNQRQTPSAATEQQPATGDQRPAAVSDTTVRNQWET